KQEDRNGNIVRFEYSGGQLSKVTDTLGRVITINYNILPSLLARVTTNGVGGAPRIIDIGADLLDNPGVLRSGETPAQRIEDLFKNLDKFPNASPTKFNPQVIRSISLPGGYRWEFLYNSYGEVRALRCHRAE